MAPLRNFITLSEGELEHFLGCKDWWAHKPPRSGPLPSVARFALSTALRTWRTRETPVDLAERLGVSEHANHDFLRLVEACGYCIPQPQPVRTSLAVRGLACMISLALAVSAHRRLRAQFLGSDSHGAWISSALEKMLSRLAALIAFGLVHRRRWTALVAGAHLGLNRMPGVFAANRLGIPMVLIFLDQEELTPRTSLELVRGDLVVACITFSPDLPRRSGLSGDYALALRHTSQVSRSTNFSALSVGVVIDRGVTPHGTAEVIEQLAQLPAVQTILLRLHPSHDSRAWSKTAAAAHSKVVLSSEESIDQYAERVDLCLTTWTGARNRLRRAGVPIWYLGGAVFGEAAGPSVRAHWGNSNSDIPQMPQDIQSFVSRLTAAELKDARSLPQSGATNREQRQESVCWVIRQAIQASRSSSFKMGSGDGRPDGTRLGTA